MIVICEPQCEGFVHAVFNAAVIAMVSAAFEAEKIIFFAEKEHLKLVKQRLDYHSIDNIEYEELVIPLMVASNFGRAPLDFKICKYIFKYAQRMGASKILYISTTSPLLLSIKLLLPLFHKLRCIVIPHSILFTITKWPKKRLLGIPFWFKPALLFGNSERLRHLIIGKITKDWLISRWPYLDKYLYSFETPCLFDNNQYASKDNDDEFVRFGFFGVANIHKGIELFIRLSDEINNLNTRKKAEFILIGHIANESVRELNFGKVEIPSPGDPLSGDDYERYAHTIDYSMILYDPKFYNLIPGSSIMDSLNYLKPIISLKTIFMESYFKDMGDIGYLCDNYDDIKKDVISILNDFPVGRYKQQCDTILNRRHKISPQELSMQFYDQLVGFWA